MSHFLPLFVSVRRPQDNSAGKKILEVCSPSLCTKWATLRSEQVVQGCFELDIENLQGWRRTACMGNLIICSQVLKLLPVSLFSQCKHSSPDHPDDLLLKLP